MAGNISFEDLKSEAAAGTIGTVLVCIVDMQGRLAGKRFHAEHFVESAWEETHCCDYLLATDLEMATPEGYEATSWESGYGDYIMKPAVRHAHRSGREHTEMSSTALPGTRGERAQEEERPGPPIECEDESVIRVRVYKL